MSTVIYDGPAVLVQAGTRVTVVCTVSGLEYSWSGMFWEADPPLTLNLGGVDALRLPDGRSARIRLGCLYVDRRSGTFYGSEALIRIP